MTEFNRDSLEVLKNIIILFALFALSLPALADVEGWNSQEEQSEQYVCYSNLRLANGAYVASYRGRSPYTEQEACSNALRTCYTDLHRRQNNSRYRNAYCEIDQRRRPVPPNPNPTPTPNPDPTIVTRVCHSALLSDEGEIIQTFEASVSGRSDDRTIGREACDLAMKQCMAMRAGSESCRLN